MNQGEQRAESTLQGDVIQEDEEMIFQRINSTQVFEDNMIQLQEALQQAHTNV